MKKCTPSLVFHPSRPFFPRTVYGGLATSKEWTTSACHSSSSLAILLLAPIQLGPPCLRFIDVCKRDMKQGGINISSWEEVAANRSIWRKMINSGTETVQSNQMKHKREKRQRLAAKTTSSSPSSNTFACPKCNRLCRSRIGLYSHQRACVAKNNTANHNSNDQR